MISQYAITKSLAHDNVNSSVKSFDNSPAQPSTASKYAAIIQYESQQLIQ